MASTSTRSNQSSGASRSHPVVDPRGDDGGPKSSHHLCESSAEEAGYHSTAVAPSHPQTDPETRYRQSSQSAYPYNLSSDERAVALLPTELVGGESGRPQRSEDLVPEESVPAKSVPSVETASSTATTPCPKDTEHTTPSSESLRSVQFAMTLLFLLLAPAALLSVCVAQHYRLLVITFWILLWMLFGSLIWFLQYVTHHPAVLHPALHRMARAIVQEYRHFVTDWQNEILLLTNGSDQPLQQQQQQQQQGDRGDERNAARPRPKSRIFRALVQPLVPFLTRRRQSKRERTEKRQRQKRAANSALPPEDAYSPPDYQLV